MAMSRYSFTGKVNRGKSFGTSLYIEKIFKGVESGIISFSTRKLRGNERLDVIAGEAYDNSSYWWIISAASGIGWCLQAPAGTIIRVPTNISEIFNLLA